MLTLHILYVWAYWHYHNVSVDGLMRNLAQRGNRVTVLLGEQGNFNTVGKRNAGIDFRSLPALDFLSRIMGTPYPILRGVSSHVRRIDPDLVHVHSHLFLSSYQAVRAAHSLELPSVVTVHGVTAQRGWLLNLSQQAYLRTVSRMLFRKVAAIVCLTGDDAESIAKVAGSASKIHVIPNGVNVQLFSPGQEYMNRLVVWTGRFVSEKGLNYLIEAVRIVNRQVADARFLLVGSGPLEAKIAKQVRDLGLPPKVVSFPGPLERGKVVQVLKKATVFVLPSLKEGLPRSILEAMACAVPVIGSDISGINDVVIDGKNGFLVPPRNPEVLAHKIIMVLKDEELRKRLSGEARRSIVEKHDIAAIALKMERLYHSLVAEAK